MEKDILNKESLAALVLRWRERHGFDSHPQGMSPEDLYDFCANEGKYLNKGLLIIALERYFGEDVDEIDYAPWEHLDRILKS